MTKSRAFKPPGKKVVQPTDHQIEFVVADVAETAHRAPEEKQQAYYSGGKKRHTLESRVVVNGRTRQVSCTHHGRGPVHDFALYQRGKVGPHKSPGVFAGSGPQVLSKLRAKCRTPQ